MRKRVLFLLLMAFVVPPRLASADPLQITNGAFLLDIEGDLFTFNGDGFSLTTIGPDGLSPVQPDGIGIYSTKQFPSQCFFCAEGELIDWSFETTGSEQLLGRGNAVLDGVNATNVDFVGSMRFNAVPTPLSSGGRGEFDFMAPFSFEAAIRGMQGGQELFARQFVGTGSLKVHYEQSGTPGVFVSDDDRERYEFAEPVPEPGTLLLLGSGLACAALRRRRREA